MVVFTCNNCGEALQKPKVAKHYQFQCRKAIFLTCTDCLKDFRGEEYVTHTKCVTEAERYGGKNYVAKPGANKGERKQQEWINIVHNLLNSSMHLSNTERNFLNSLCRYDNIPRKKAKFMNFIRSAFGSKVNMTVVESAWGKMETAHKQNIENNVEQSRESNGNHDKELDSSISTNQENNIAENQNNENICKESEDQQNITNDSCEAENDGEQIQIVNNKKKSKKRGLTESSKEETEQSVSKKRNKSASVLVESNHTQATSDEIKFDWKTCIIDIVSAKEEISLKKLQKKVIGRYMVNYSDTTHEKALAKFNKKLKKVPNIVVTDKKVRLSTN